MKTIFFLSFLGISFFSHSWGGIHNQVKRMKTFEEAKELYVLQNDVYMGETKVDSALVKYSKETWPDKKIIFIPFQEGTQVSKGKFYLTLMKLTHSYHFNSVTTTRKIDALGIFEGFNKEWEFPTYFKSSVHGLIIRPWFDFIGKDLLWVFQNTTALSKLRSSCYDLNIFLLI